MFVQINLKAIETKVTLRVFHTFCRPQPLTNCRWFVSLPTGDLYETATCADAILLLEREMYASR